MEVHQSVRDVEFHLAAGSGNRLRYVGPILQHIHHHFLQLASPIFIDVKNVTRKVFDESAFRELQVRKLDPQVEQQVLVSDSAPWSYLEVHQGADRAQRNTKQQHRADK